MNVPAILMRLYCGAGGTGGWSLMSAGLFTGTPGQSSKQENLILCSAERWQSNVGVLLKGRETYLQFPEYMFNTVLCFNFCQ